MDKLEKAVKDGSHSEYHKLLNDIETKRTKMLNVAEMRRSLAEGNVNNFFNSQKYAAYSQYYVSIKKTLLFLFCLVTMVIFKWDKLALRRSMIQHVQRKINTLEQEYYSNHVQSKFDWVLYDLIQKITREIGSLDDEHLSEWVPPDRPSMINILFFYTISKFH